MVVELTTVRSAEPKRSQLILNAHRRLCLTYGPFDFTTTTSQANVPVLTLFLPEVISRNPQSKLVRATLSWSQYTTTSSSNVLKANLHDLTNVIYGHTGSYTAATKTVNVQSGTQFNKITPGMLARITGSIANSGLYVIETVNQDYGTFVLTTSAGPTDDNWITALVTQDLTSSVILPVTGGGMITLPLTSYYLQPSTINPRMDTLWQLHLDCSLTAETGHSVSLSGAVLTLELEPVQVAGSSDDTTTI